MKKLLVAIAVLFFSIGFSQQKTWDGDLNNPEHGWHETPSLKRVEIANSTLILTSPPPGGLKVLNNLNMDKSKDFTIEYTARLVGGSTYDFVVNTDDNGNSGYYINLSEKMVRINKFDGLNYHTQAKHKLGYFNYGVNHTLTIEKTDGHVKVWLRQMGRRIPVLDEKMKWVQDRNSFGFHLESGVGSKAKLYVTDVNAKYYTKELASVSAEVSEQFESGRESVGSAINTEFEELGPVISSDGNTLFFTRQNLLSTKSYDRIMQSDALGGVWVKAENTLGSVNGKFHASIIQISPDGKKMYVQGYFKNGKPVKGGISVSNLYGNTWSTPIGIEIDHAKNKSEHISEYITSDGRILVTALENAHSHGGTDLFVSFVNADGGFSGTINLGKVVNTHGDEGAPYLCSDNQTLFFASNGHDGYGDMDIFMTKRLDETWENWSEPVNLGPEVNSSKWDAYMTVPANGAFAYYVSYKGTVGGGDIFRIQLDESFKPDPVIILNGVVKDLDTKLPLKAKVIYKDLKSGKVIGEVESDPTTGAYQVVLPYKSEYAIYADAGDYFSKRDTMNLTSLTEFKELHKDLFLKKIQIGATIELSNVFFVQSKSVFMPGSFDELNKLLSLMKENPTMKIKINGHTDVQGSKDKNLELSQQRADKVRDYLIEKGISKSRIKTEGFGGNKPIYRVPKNREEHDANRRVEFTILEG